MYLTRSEIEAASSGIEMLYRREYVKASQIYKAIHDKLRNIQDPHVGMTLWLTGDYNGACIVWRGEIERMHGEREIVYTDGAGGVLLPAILWWASSHEGIEGYGKAAKLELKKRLRTKRSQMPVYATVFSTNAPK